MFLWLKEFVKIVLSVVLILPLTLILLPLIVIAAIVFNGLAGLEILFTKLRRDPKNVLEVPVDSSRLWPDPDKPIAADIAKQYFNEIIKFITEKSDGKTSTVRQLITEVDDKHQGQTDESKIMTLSATVDGRHANIAISLALDATPDGNSGYYIEQLLDKDEYYEGVDNLAGYTTALLAQTDSHPALKFNIYNKPLSIWFIIGVLRGTLVYNAQTQQWWVHIKEHDIWIVKYASVGYEYGLRSEKTTKMARRFWWDT